MGWRDCRSGWFREGWTTAADSLEGRMDRRSVWLASVSCPMTPSTLEPMNFLMVSLVRIVSAERDRCGLKCN